MLESLNENQELEYQKLSPEEQTQRGILGRLKGVIADFKNPTRNGRRYTEALWSKVFDDPITKEKLDNRLIYGECGHPADRQEIDFEKIAICLAEQPKKGKDGKLYGVFDILNTPCGKILKTLCDYGSKVGVSSRGSGDTFMDINGEETVDPDTYEFVGFDAVILPAVKDARPGYVNESLGSKALKQALNESLQNAKDEDKKVMEEVINELNESINESCGDIEAQKLNEVVNNESDKLMSELQESLKNKAELEKTIISLQEKLSVSYAKEATTNEELSKLKKAIAGLTENANKVNALNERVVKLTEDLNKSNSTNNSLQDKIKELDSKINDGSIHNNSLMESLSAKDANISKLNEEKESLLATIADLKKDIELKDSDYSKKLGNANKLVESYKKASATAVDKYIDSQAIMLGISSNEVKNKLPESYTFEDIDAVCEDLQSLKVTRSKLPFQSATIPSNARVKVKQSQNESLSQKIDNDDVDESLLRLAGLI